MTSIKDHWDENLKQSAIQLKTVNWEENRRKLAQRRKELGLSQLDLALRMDSHADVISHLETGRTTPRLTTIMRYLKALDEC